MQSKLVTALATAISLAPLPALAASDHGHGSHDAMHATSSAASTQLVEGLVKKIDRKGGKVTLQHGPMPNGMPAMTMAFRLKDPAWADQMKEGGKIRFAADQVNGATTVVRFEPVK